MGKEGAAGWVVPAINGTYVPAEWRSTWDHDDIQGTIPSHNWTTLHSACAMAHGWHHDRPLAHSVCDAIVEYYPRYGLQGGETGSSWRYGDWHLGPYLVWQAISYALGRTDTYEVCNSMLLSYRLLSALSMGWKRTVEGWVSTMTGSRSWIANVDYQPSHPDDKYLLPDGRLKPPQHLCVDTCGYHDNHAPAYLGIVPWVWWQRDIINALKAHIPQARGFQNTVFGERALFEDLVNTRREGQNTLQLRTAMELLEEHCYLRVPVAVIRTTESVCYLPLETTKAGSTSFLHARPWFAEGRPNEYREWWADQFESDQGWIYITPQRRKAGEAGESKVVIEGNRVFIEAMTDEGNHWSAVDGQWHDGPVRKRLTGEPVFIGVIKPRNHGVVWVYPERDEGPGPDPEPQPPSGWSAKKHVRVARRQCGNALEHRPPAKEDVKKARNNLNKALEKLI